MARARAASLQSMIDRGEAATMEAAQQLLSKQGNLAALQNMIDRGEAATLEEAAARGRSARCRR